MKSIIKVTLKNMSQTNGGKFEGWGTSLCWWANRLGYSDLLAQQAADLFFGNAGLRLNIMRYNIGGGDDPSHNHITRTDSAIPGWIIYDETSGEYHYDYSADHNQLNVLKRCYKAADNAYVEVFSNSPPYFMTVSGCSSGHEDPNKDNLREECYEEFAEYLAHVTGYINHNLEIKVKSISPMNEPNTSHWWKGNWKQEGCHFDAQSHSQILCKTAKAIRKQGLSDILVVGSDEYSPQNQIIAYNAYTDETKQVVGRISTHTYDTVGIDELGKLAKAEGFNLWMSEVDGGAVAGENAGEMGAPLWLAEKIISDINSLSPSAWVTWQVIDTHICEAGYQGNKDGGMVDINKGYWGTAVADHDKEEIILTKKYYGFGQFTRYIRPGATIIHCGSDVLAAYDGTNKQLTIVAINKTKAEKTMVFDLSDFSKIGEKVSVVRTSGGIRDGENWKELTDIFSDECSFTADLKRNSITTFIVEGVEV